MTNQSKKVIYVNYYDSIDENKVKAVMAKCTELVNREKAQSIYFLFSSNGGFIGPGITLYNFLRALPIEIVMHNSGTVASIGTVVFLAADIRYASVHSSFLFHGSTWNFAAPAVVPKRQLSEIISDLNTCESKISGIITERTKLSEIEIAALYDQGASIGAKYALDKGIVEEIKEPQIPKGTNILSFNLT